MLVKAFGRIKRDLPTMELLYKVGSKINKKAYSVRFTLDK